MAIVIEARLPALAGIARLNSALQRATDNAAKLNATLQSVAANANAAANAMGGIGGGRASRQSGPSQSTLRQTALQNASPRTFGNRPLGSLNLNTPRYRGAKPPIIKAQQNPFVQVVSRAIMRTRFKVGNAQVLGTDIMQILGGLGGGGGSAGGAGGIGGAAGKLSQGLPFLAALKGAEAGLKTFIAAARMASETLNQWRSSLVSGGGSTAQATSAQALGGLLGTDLASTGKNLTPVAAAMMGLSPVTGPYGDMNYNKRGLRAADWVRSSGSFDQARRRSELAGDPNLANGFFQSDANYNGVRNRPGVNVEAMASAANIQASAQRITDDFKHIIVDIMAPALKGVARLMEWVAGVLDRIREWVSGIMKRLGLDNGESDRQRKALDRNTDALNSWREGTFGGGSRAAGATPDKFHPLFGGNPTPGGVI